MSPFDDVQPPFAAFRSTNNGKYLTYVATNRLGAMMTVDDSLIFDFTRQTLDRNTKLNLIIDIPVFCRHVRRRQAVLGLWLLNHYRVERVNA
jgi:hypothetical protein